jgi:phosphoglucosamine mutase
VIRLGTVPTPAVAYLVGKYEADAGIMISASHNPAEFNGIKIFSGDGFKLPDLLEERIEALVLDDASSIPTPVGAGLGRVRAAENACRDYIDHIKSTVPHSLTGLRIAVDCANGSASGTAETLFRELGADVHMLADHPDGININENCGSTHMEALAQYVRENGMDCGVAFDGDADRCLCVDEKGNMVDGDMIMSICAMDLKERGKLNHNAVVGTIMTNFGFGKFCEEYGLHFCATKVGDRFVLEEMLQEDYSFGGEQSGHVIFREYATTGDGQLTAAQLLSVIARTKKSLSDLNRLMVKYPQRMENIRVNADGKLRFYTDHAVKEAIDEAKAFLGETGRVVVRPSGTEPLIRVMAEGESDEAITRAVKMVSDAIKSRLL